MKEIATTGPHSKSISTPKSTARQAICKYDPLIIELKNVIYHVKIERPNLILALALGPYRPKRRLSGVECVSPKATTTIEMRNRKTFVFL